MLFTALFSGCSVLGVYKIDIPQGNPLTQAQASQVKVGMTQDQVRYLIGTPTFNDSLNGNRWDYVYNFIPGTNARKAKIPAAHGQHLAIYFDQNGTVSRIDGLDTLPQNQPGLPNAKPSLLSPIQ